MQNKALRLNEHSSDDALRFGCCQGDALAQKYLYQRWFGKLLGVPMRYTSNREEAIEVLNTAFLKIFESIQNYRMTEKGTFSGWMARIVFNTSIDFVRKKSNYQQKYDWNAEADLPIENEVLGKLAAEDIYQFIQQLPATTRSVFSLFALDGYKHSEIAEMLEITEGTSRWHVGQARKTLRTLVSNHYLNA